MKKLSIVFLALAFLAVGFANAEGIAAAVKTTGESPLLLESKPVPYNQDKTVLVIELAAFVYGMWEKAIMKEVMGEYRLYCAGNNFKVAVSGQMDDIKAMPVDRRWDEAINVGETYYRVCVLGSSI